MSDQQAATPCLMTSQFSPSQQIALLTMQRSPLAQAVLATLRSSTVRAGARDFRFLVDKGLAEHGTDGWHHLTDRGDIIAAHVLHALASQYRVYGPLRPKVSARRRSTLRRGLFSQAGNA